MQNYLNELTEIVTPEAVLYGLIIPLGIIALFLSYLIFLQQRTIKRQNAELEAVDLYKNSNRVKRRRAEKIAKAKAVTRKLKNRR